jgi:hypothetical protein
VKNRSRLAIQPAGRRHLRGRNAKFHNSRSDTKYSARIPDRRLQPPPGRAPDVDPVIGAGDAVETGGVDNRIEFIVPVAGHIAVHGFAHQTPLNFTRDGGKLRPAFLCSAGHIIGIQNVNQKQRKTQ